MTEPILQIKDLSVYYNKKKALNSVSFDVLPHEITALIGPSGSGKSTLLKAINRMGDLNPEVTTTGTVIYNGHNIYSPRTDTVELRKEIGMVFQQPNPFPMTIYENVVYGLRINGVKDKEILDEVVETSLKGASIWDEVKDRLNDSAIGLSGGQQQRVCVARVLATSPKIILLDEPTSALSEPEAKKLFHVIEKLKKKGTTVVLIEHRLYYVKSLFDRFLLMKDGEIAQDLSREEVIHLEGEFWDENGLRTLELEEYRISEKKDSYQLNDESISGKGLKFCYPSTTKVGNKQKQYILNHLDFNMECGKAIGLIGLNGTGKTTFARMISGLEKIKEGTISAGKDKSLNHKDLMDMSYFVFQDSDYQLFSESVLDEMLLGMEGKDKKENIKKAKSILSVLGLDKYIDKHPFALSRGEKQRLTIACGMMKQVKIFIYDEPTSGCDKDSMLSVAKLIEEQLKNGTTVLVISHDFEFLANTVSEVAVMEDGKIENVLNMSESNKFLILDKMRGGRELVR